MTIKTISYQKAFVIGPYLQERIGVEIELSDTDDPEKAFQLAKEMTEDFHKQANPHLEGEAPIQGPPAPPREIQVEKATEEIRIGVIVEDIMSCKDLVTVDSYKLLVKGKPELEAAYAKRRKEIVDGQVKEILNKTEQLTKKQ